MSKASTLHSTFVIEREYAAAPARAFAAWADPESKQRWFACHDEWKPARYELNFRVGGREHLTTVPPDGVAHVFDAVYFDIVPNERIVYGYDMHLDEKRMSVSLATVEFKADGKGTKLIFTEQAVFLDEYALPSVAAEREDGTRIGLGNLDKELLRPLA